MTPKNQCGDYDDDAFSKPKKPGIRNKKGKLSQDKGKQAKKKENDELKRALKEAAKKWGLDEPDKDDIERFH